MLGMYIAPVSDLAEYGLTQSVQIYASLGELLCIQASPLGTETAGKQLGRSVRLFCRSIELCDDYLRGFYGLALVGHCR